MKMKVGLYNKNFQMSNKEISIEERCKVRDNNSIFKITAGPLIFNGEQLKNTYVLEVNFRESEDVHRRSLILEGFNSQLCGDYAETAHKIASDFCKKQGFTINNHLNSWPEYQAVVTLENPIKSLFA